METSTTTTTDTEDSHDLCEWCHTTPQMDDCPRCAECDEHATVCDDCGNVSHFEVTRYDEHSDTTVCDNCYHRRWTHCDDCRSMVRRADTVHVSGHSRVCFTCEEQYSYCEPCGRYCPSDDMSWSEQSGIAVCPSCVARLFHWCDDCDSLVPDDEGCQCGGSAVHEYSYKPSPEFLGDGPRYFGVELELEHNGNRVDVLEALSPLADGEVYLKQDGSLNDGVEIVSHPASLAHHQSSGHGVVAAADAARRAGARSWDGGTCGIHVHVSRDAFTARHLFVWSLFWYRNANAVLAYSGRATDDLHRWASTTADRSVRLSDRVKGKRMGARYTAVNLQGSDTAEVRVFRGSLDTRTILGAVELCDALADFTADMSYVDVRDGALTWDGLCEWIAADDTRRTMWPNFVSTAIRRGVWRWS